MDNEIYEAAIEELDDIASKFSERKRKTNVLKMHVLEIVIGEFIPGAKEMIEDLNRNVKRMMDKEFGEDFDEKMKKARDKFLHLKNKQ